jgi:endonuclease YncB( thermonuclease family)
MKKYLLSLVLISSIALADTPVWKFNPADVEVYDGDTIKTKYAPIEGLPPISIRIIGIDTPEMRGDCPKETELAIKAKNALVTELNKGPFTVYPKGWDKYGGRIDGTVIAHDGTLVSARLVKMGLAKPYTGKVAKTSWCN